MKNILRCVSSIRLPAIIIFAIIIGFVIIACDKDPGSDPGNENVNGIKNLIGARIANTNITGQVITFSVNQTSASRSLFESTYPVNGQLQIGSTILNISGFYCPDSGNFTFSGAAGDYAFEFFGTANEGMAMGKVKLNSSDTWSEELVMFEFDPSILVSGTAVQSAQGLPEKWMGAWECWGDDFEGNAQLAEQWRTMQDGYMILTPHSIGFWFDFDKEIRELDEGIEDLTDLGVFDEESEFYWGMTAEEYREDMFYNYWNKMGDYSILEVTHINDNTYDVLVLNAVAPWSIFDEGDVEYFYRKLRFMQGTGDYSDELWVIFCQFGDGGEWDTYTDDISEARESTNFIYDRSEWEVENYSLHVSKKVPWWN